MRRAESAGADWLARLLYYAGIPYAAVMLGAADFPAYLGLARFDWPASVGRGAILGLCIFAGLAGTAWYSIQGLRQMGDIPAAPKQCAGWHIILDAFLLEAHWAFYRLPGILLTGDLLIGTFMGAGLAILEHAGDPRWRSRALSAQTAVEAWQGIALLAGMAAAFYFTRNFFVLWATHAVLDWANQKLHRRLARSL